jgi:signal transduction histidine kinase
MLGMILGLFCAAAPASAAEEEARVLILNGIDPNLPAYLAVESAMRASLASQTAPRIIFFSEALDAQRFPLEGLEPELLALLAKKYRGLHVNVVVAFTLPALEFFKRHGEQLWPGARLVILGFPGENIAADALPPNATAIVAREDIVHTIELAQRLQPDSRRIVVVAGVSEFDKRGEQLTRTALSTWGEHASVEFLSGLPLPELVARVAGEPASTIVIYLSQFRDSGGRPYTPREVLRAISLASVAPVYGIAETLIGSGAVAGIVESYEARGSLVGEQVRAALTGVLPAPSQVVLAAPSRCIADARALQRWSLDERRLPGGCDILFADRPLWRQYEWQIAATLAIIAGQAALIGAFVVQRRRRRVAESESEKRYLEMAHMNRRVALGEMSASIAHELNQPLGAIRNNAGAAEILIKADPPRLQEVADILADIQRDDQRASDIIERIRKLLRKAPFEGHDMDLNEAIEDTLRLAAGEAAAKEVVVKTELEPGLPMVSADRVQLQQVILNLVLNAIEAMHQQSAASRVLTVRSARAGDNEAEVSVSDSGAGIPGESITAIFGPFVSTKPGGMGLGLAISRTIIEAHGGAIHAENAAQGGAVFRFTLPFAPASRA